MSLNYDLLEYGILHIFVDSKIPNQKPVAFNKNMMSYSLSKIEEQPESLITPSEETPNNPNKTEKNTNSIMDLSSPRLIADNILKFRGGEASTVEGGIVIALNTRFPEKMFQRLMKKTAKERINDLSDRKVFQELLISSLNDSSQILENSIENKSQISEIVEYNVVRTLGLIFPTKFPASFNISTSYGELISPGSQPLSFPNVSPSTYSYITLNGKKYTITKVLWLNDFYNHPVYRDFIMQYIEFYGRIERERKKIAIDYLKEYKYFIDRIKCTSTNSSRIREKKSLCILDTEYEGIINNKIKEIEEKITNRKSYSSKFKEELEKIQEKLKELKDIVDKEINEDGISSNIYNIRNILETISKLYKQLRLNRTESIILPNSFQYRLEECQKVLKNIYALGIIKTDYIFNDYFNIKIQNEEPDVIKRLESSYKWYIDFISKTKEITPPKRMSMKSFFQELLNSFTKTQEDTYAMPESTDTTKEDLFKQLLEYVKYRLIYRKPFNSNLSSVSEQMNIGVSQMNLLNTNQNTFEIYISLDLLEDEINDSNINDIKCDWRGLYLGNKVENFLQKSNEFDAKKIQLLITKNELYSNKNSKSVPLIKGGRKTRKYKGMTKEKKYIRHSIKTR